MEEEDGPQNTVDAFGRKVWDKEYYQQKADQGSSEEEQFELIPASQRTYLQRRNEELNIDSEIGKQRIVTSATGDENKGGFYCHLCKCLMKDSLSWLDHINGKKHTRMLGMNQAVKRSTVEEVLQHLEMLRRKKKGEHLVEKKVTEEDILRKMQEYEEKEKRVLEEAREKKRRKKEKKQEEADLQILEEEERIEEDPELQMMREMGIPVAFS